MQVHPAAYCRVWKAAQWTSQLLQEKRCVVHGNSGCFIVEFSHSDRELGLKLGAVGSRG